MIEGSGHRVLAVCTSGIHRENVRDTVRELVAEGAKLGFRTVILNTFLDMYNKDAFTKGEASIFSLIESPVIDAVIVMPEAIKSEEVIRRIVERAKRRGLPVISIDGMTEGCRNIVFNYGDSFEQIVRHVIDVHGCRRIHYVAGLKDNPFSEERTQRFLKVIEEKNIPAENIRIGHGDFWEEPAAALAESWFTSGEPLPEAVICANDSMALAVCGVLRDHKVRVPQDVIVTGFDGIELEKYFVPRLTTCAADIGQAGRTAAATADTLLNGGTAPEVTEIPYAMRVAQSCGCHRIHSADLAGKIMSISSDIAGNEAHESFMFDYLRHTLGCRRKSELAETMKRFGHFDMWCCTGAGYFSDKLVRQRFGDFPAEMRLLATNVEGHSFTGKFPTGDLLPTLPEILESRDSVMFSPIHSESDLIGYLGISIELDKNLFLMARRFTMLTDQILWNYKNRLVIERANEKLAEMHIHDPMTGTLNRRGFYKKASRMIKRIESRGGCAVIFSADMDGLKQINDSFGHNEGDKAIKALASALIKCAGSESICARFGGDEFIIMTAAENAEQAGDFAERVQGMLDDHVRRVKAPYRIRVSIGAVDRVISETEELDECIRLADELMYREKREHKKQED